MYCNRCDREFWSDNAYFQHIDNSSKHNECQQCCVDFDTHIGLKEHYVQSPHHAYCQYCDYHFDYADELEDHYENDHAFCAFCHSVFKNNYGLEEHYRQSPAHNYCALCKRHFYSANNLANHLNSAIHKAKDVMCPTLGCGLGFVSHSALVLHMESGTCKSGINRQMVNTLVHRYDTNNLITDPGRMLTGSHGHQQHFTYYASEASFNHYTQSPQSAPGSQAHEQESYLCRGPTCGARFRALSALVQHIESQKCGVARFVAVQNAMANVFGHMNRIGIYASVIDVTFHPNFLAAFSDTLSSVQLGDAYQPSLPVSPRALSWTHMP